MVKSECLGTQHEVGRRFGREVCAGVFVAGETDIWQQEEIGELDVAHGFAPNRRGDGRSETSDLSNGSSSSSFHLWRLRRGISRAAQNGCSA